MAKKKFKNPFQKGDPVKKETRILAIVVLICAVVLGIISWFVLPDQVAFQALNGVKNYLPKYLTMILPTLLAVGCGLIGVFGKLQSLVAKMIILSLIGDFLYLMHLCLTLLP